MHSRAKCTYSLSINKCDVFCCILFIGYERPHSSEIPTLAQTKSSLHGDR